ncbi:MAG TPA: helix-turn-helix transcriptional regulator [Gammaproteobacteria bacterium]|nr:helix-turn-helix transcriptional regulator [Gammaproteobacteria bacterium]
MDVQVDGNLIRAKREQRAWSQEHLAAAAGIGARTIQRIEATGVASYESVRAISAALETPISALSLAAEPGPAPRLRLAARWLGAAVALAFFAGASGFLLMKDYKKVRVLRTLEQWVTTDAGPTTGAANRTDGG